MSLSGVSCGSMEWGYLNAHWWYFFQHVVFGICRLIDILVPDIPQSLELKIKREGYLAKQALADTDTLMQVCA